VTVEVARRAAVARDLGNRDLTSRFLLAGFVLLALIVALPVGFAASERSAEIAGEAALLTRDHLADLLSSVRQAESGLRGYMLTDNQASITTYNMAVQAVPPELTQLDSALADGPEAGQLLQVHDLVTEKLRQLAAAMALWRAGNHPAAVALVNTDLNLQTMQQLRTQIGAMEAAQTRRFEMIRADDDRDGWLLQVATSAAVLGTALLAFFALRESRWQTAQLRTAECSLIAANEALEQKVEERTQTLLASERQFRTLAETLPGFVFTAAAGGGNTYVSPQFCAFTGQTAEQVLREGWSACLHPDDVAPTYAARRQTLAEGTPFEIEYRFRRHDGVYRWFLGRSVPVRDEAGEIVSWIGTGTDIDARKKAEAALVESNATLEQRVAARTRELERIFNLSTDIIAVSNFAGEFVALSPAWERITGHSVAAGIGNPIAAHLHPDDVGETEAVRASLHGGEPASVVNRYRRADGNYCWLSWHSVPLPDEQLIYSVARDITAEREREEQLRQSQKMEVVGQLTGGVAHDFNNLLTIILGSLELLQRGLGNADPRLSRRVEAAMDGAKRAAALTHRLLAFSRRQPLAPRAIDVNRLLAGMSDMLHRTLGEAVAVDVVPAAGLWPALADANQLENAVLNLAVNARDAMPAGGLLTIETQNAYLDEPTAAAPSDAAAGQYVMIAVSDNGAGMSPEVKAKLFEPFFTTKPQGQGTGLGLAQVYGFIKQSDGHVEVFSESGEGTTIRLYLPRPRGESLAESMPVVDTAPHNGAGETILLVEDEEGVRNFGAEILEELGYRVLTAEHGVAALAVLDAHPELALLFTDVVLTGPMNGRMLADEAARRRPNLPVLFTTGYTSDAIIHHGRLDEGINFIGKPFTAAALAQAIRQALDQVVHATPAPAKS
jgi:PAS domain S-box-containing protein